MPGRYRSDAAKAVNITRMRTKDPEAARQAEAELAEASDVVEHAAYLAMAAMLLVLPSSTYMFYPKIHTHIYSSFLPSRPPTVRTLHYPRAENPALHPRSAPCCGCRAGFSALGYAEF